MRQMPKFRSITAISSIVVACIIAMIVQHVLRIFDARSAFFTVGVLLFVINVGISIYCVAYSRFKVVWSCYILLNVSIFILFGMSNPLEYWKILMLL
jgi:hypothetical protein